MAELSLKNICKKYNNEFMAVKNVNLDIADKEFVVFVGPSGCGKTTTLRMIAGLEEISKGELWIDGRYMNDAEPKDRDIAMVFQNYALYPHMSVYDNMAFGLKLRKTPKSVIDLRVKETAKILDIYDLLNRKPKALSGGQRQRVAMGRAIVREPKVFLMDEPLSNLDAKLRVQMRTEISRLHQRLQTTFIYVTHDQTEAMTLGSRIVVMKDGIVQQADSPKKLYNNPCNMFVAGFIGSPQMNFIEGKVMKKENKVLLQIGSDYIELSGSKAKIAECSCYSGKNVMVGIRPEDIYVENRNNNYLNCFKAKIEVTELLGSEIYLYLNMSGFNVTAKVDSSLDFKAGNYINIFLNESNIHLFDKESERAITN